VPPEDRDRLLLARPLARDASLPFVLRLDRVDFTPGADTPAHGHHGQGIRRLLDGRLLLRIADRVERRNPGEAWFETGDEPVTARGLTPGTAFIRVLVMDADMQGRSSFLAWTPEDAAAPRNVTYRLFLDEITRLA
jgi:quercetin dioxygenase-like cupin family protein